MKLQHLSKSRTALDALEEKGIAPD